MILSVSISFAHNINRSTWLHTSSRPSHHSSSSSSSCWSSSLIDWLPFNVLLRTVSPVNLVVFCTRYHHCSHPIVIIIPSISSIAINIHHHQYASFAIYQLLFWEHCEAFQCLLGFLLCVNCSQCLLEQCKLLLCCVFVLKLSVIITIISLFSLWYW